MDLGAMRFFAAAPTPVDFLPVFGVVLLAAGFLGFADLDVVVFFWVFLPNGMFIGICIVPFL
jgi:hypothetical protein